MPVLSELSNRQIAKPAGAAFSSFAAVMLLTFFLTTTVIASNQDDATAKTDTAETKPIPASSKLLRHCKDCHGTDGSGNLKTNTPHIAGQNFDYMLAVTLNHKAGLVDSVSTKSTNAKSIDDQHIKPSSGVHQVYAKLEEAQLRSLVLYYAELKTPWTLPKISDHKEADPAALIQQGNALATPCKACHGADGNSHIKGLPSLAGLSAEYLEKAFSDYFSGTRTDSMMQAFSLSTSTAQIKQLAAYYASLPRKSVAPAKVKSPPKSYLGLCNGCHGLNGNSGNPNIPSLSGQNPSYLEKAMLAYRDGKRNDNAMKAAVTDLKMAMIKQLAQYYAAQTPIQVATAGVSGFNPLLEGKILASACDGCHGKNGNSELSGTPSLSGQPLTYLVNGINAYRSGKRNVPIMQAATTYLSDLDVEKISLYYSKQKPQRRSSRKMESPEQVSGCNGCHGDNGNSTSSDVPSLAGQDRHYLSKALSEYKDGKRPHDDMQNATKSLNKSQIAALAEYYSTLTRVQVENLAFEDPKSLAQKCNRCHGHIEQPDKPRIAGQIKTYLLKSLQAYKSKSRENSMMHAMSDVLSLTEMDAIASFYATKVK